MTAKYKFDEGERVLCFHGPLIYEAKALKTMVTKDKQVKYYIHYAGWNKNWDEWVPENRVLKYNDVNVQRQTEVLKSHKAIKTKKGEYKDILNKELVSVMYIDEYSIVKGKKGSEPTTLGHKDGGASSGGSESRPTTPSTDVAVHYSNTGPQRSNRSKQTGVTAAKESENANNKEEETTKEESQKKKRGGSTSNTSDKTGGSEKPSSTTTSTCVTPTPGSSTSGNRLDLCVESEESFLSKIEVKIKIPDELKQCLADDWDAITRQHKLIDIPAKLTVQDIVDQYIVFKKASKTINASKEIAIIDVLNGVVEYFNVMLGSQLLYKFERQQYAEILQQYPETPVAKLYGAFHLLRLFVKLGSMLVFSALDDKSMQLLLGHLHDFLKFLVKNSATYFAMTNFVNVSPEYHRNTQ